MAKVILAIVVLAALACGVLSAVLHLRRGSHLRSRVARRLKEERSMKVEVVHQLGWLELFDLQLVGTEDSGVRRNYLLQSGQRRGKAVLYRVPGDMRIDPESPVPPGTAVVDGDERTRVLCAIGEADNNGWDSGDQLSEFTREPVRG